MSLKNKRVLITAGPTWVPIDRVRVISNVATGRTGILLSKRLLHSGARVTLLLGPGESSCINGRIKLVRFKFFDELKNLLKRELKKKKYDIVIHAAAVSDYKPENFQDKKVKSGIKKWQLSLIPAEKIIDSLRKLSKSLFIVGFKFEPDAGKDILVKKAKELIRRADLDLAVANTIKKNKYRAFILGRRGIYAAAGDKGGMADKLVDIIREQI